MKIKKNKLEKRLHTACFSLAWYEFFLTGICLVILLQLID